MNVYVLRAIKAGREDTVVAAATNKAAIDAAMDEHKKDLPGWMQFQYMRDQYNGFTGQWTNCEKIG